MPRLTYAIAALSINLIEIADGLCTMSDRISGRLPIVHTSINSFHIVRNLHKLVVKFVLLNLETAGVSAGQ